MFLKMMYHVIAWFRKLFLKLLYQNHIHFGKSVSIRRYFRLMIEPGGNVVIGDHTFFNHNCSLNAHEKIQIGNHCIIGENVKMYDHNHSFSNVDKPIYQQGFRTAPIIIGDNCWIGSDVTILKGVTIGDNVVIGAGCLIKEDIPSNMVVKQTVQLKLEERIARRK